MWDWFSDLFSAPTDYTPWENTNYAPVVDATPVPVYTPEPTYTPVANDTLYDYYNSPVVTPVADTTQVPTLSSSADSVGQYIPTTNTLSPEELGVYALGGEGTHTPSTYANIPTTDVSSAAQLGAYLLGGEGTHTPDVPYDIPTTDVSPKALATLGADHYTNQGNSAAGAQPSTQASPASHEDTGVLASISAALSPFEKFAKNNSTVLGLGVGGLQAYMALQEKKKLEAARKAAQEKMDAATGKSQAANAFYGRPIDYAAYAANPRQRTNIGQIDYRQSTNDPASRVHFTQGQKLAEGIKRESDARPASFAKGGSVGGGLRQASTSRLVKGSGTGQSDKVPAMLSPGEYVFDADAVAAAGDGNTEAGAKKLDEMRRTMRAHKRSASAKSIPPKAKPLMQYMNGGRT